MKTATEWTNELDQDARQRGFYEQCLHTVKKIQKNAEEEILKWTKEPPTGIGMYLRSNPVIGRATRQDIYEVEGVLVTRDKDSLIGRERTIESYSNFMWWYGPIPQPPKEEE